MKHYLKLCRSVLFFVCVSASFQASATGKGSKGQEEQHSYIGTLGRVFSCAWTSLYDMNYQILFPEGEEDSLSKHVFDFADGSETEKQRQTQREERGEVRKNQDTPVASQPKLLTQAIVKLAQLAQAYFVATPVLMSGGMLPTAEATYEVVPTNAQIVCGVSELCPLPVEITSTLTSGNFRTYIGYADFPGNLEACYKNPDGSCTKLSDINPNLVAQTLTYSTLSEFEDEWTKINVHNNVAANGTLATAFNYGTGYVDVNFELIFTNGTIPTPPNTNTTTNGTMGNGTLPDNSTIPDNGTTGNGTIGNGTLPTNGTVPGNTTFPINSTLDSNDTVPIANLTTNGTVSNATGNGTLPTNDTVSGNESTPGNGTFPDPGGGDGMLHAPAFKGGNLTINATVFGMGDNNAYLPSQVTANITAALMPFVAGYGVSPATTFFVVDEQFGACFHDELDRVLRIFSVRDVLEDKVRTNILLHQTKMKIYMEDTISGLQSDPLFVQFAGLQLPAGCKYLRVGCPESRIQNYLRRYPRGPISAYQAPVTTECRSSGPFLTYYISAEKRFGFSFMRETGA